MVLSQAQLRARTRLGLARAQLPQLQQRQTLEPGMPNGELRQQKLEQEVVRVQQDIEVEQGRLADLQFQIKEEGLTSSERGAIDDKIGESRRLLIQLGKAKVDVQQGFTFASAVSKATQTASFETKRILSERGFETQQQEVLQQFESEGLRPIFVRGQITGFRDDVRGQTIPVGNLGSLGQDRLQGLEKAGLITLTTIPLTEQVDVADFTPLPIDPTLKEKLGNIFFRGKQLIGIGIPGVPTPFITSEEIKKGLEKRGLVARVVAGFIPETPKEVLLTAGFVGGLSSLTGISAKIAGGVVTGLGTAIAVSPELSTEERIAGGVIAITPLVPFLVKKGFSPKGKKGQSAFTQTAFDEVGQFFKKKTKKKSELQVALDDFSNQLRLKREGNIIRDTTDLEKLNLIRKSLKQILKTEDPALRKAQTEGFVKLLKAELGEQKAKSIIKELLLQEGVAFRQQGRVGQELVQSIRVETAKRLVVVSPKQIDLDLLSASRFTFNQQRIARAQLSVKERFALAQLDILKRKQITKQILQQQQKISSLQKQGSSQKTIQKAREKLRSLVLQRQAVGQLGRQALVQKQTFKQKQVLRQKQILTQRLISQQKLNKLLRPGKVRLRRLRRFRIPFLLSKKPIKKVKKKTPKKFVGAFDVFSKKGGKVIRVSKRPFKSKSGARDFGASHVSKTLRASFFVKKSGRAGAKRIPTELEDFFKRNRNQFRPSKVNKKVFVEKRKFRLNSKSEVRSIQKAKRLKQPFSKKL